MSNTQKKSNHTQGEWKADETNIYLNNPEMEIMIATCQKDDNARFTENFTEAEANAQRIVKCVSMHDALVKALNNLLQIVEGEYPEDQLADKNQYNIQPIRDLLKQAEQK